MDWKVERTGPDWLMNARGQLIGYRDKMGVEHLIPQTQAQAEGNQGPLGSGAVPGDGIVLSNYREALGNTTTSGNLTLSLDKPVQRIVLDAVRQITAPADPGAFGASLTLILLCQGFAPTWAGVTWLTDGGLAPTLNTASGKRNVIVLIWDDAAGGSGAWLGMLAGRES